MPEVVTAAPNGETTSNKSWGSTLKQPLVADAGSTPCGIQETMLSKVSRCCPFKKLRGSTMPAAVSNDIRLGVTFLATLANLSAEEPLV